MQTYPINTVSILKMYYFKIVYINTCLLEVVKKRPRYFKKSLFSPFLHFYSQANQFMTLTNNLPHTNTKIFEQKYT